MKYKRFEYRHIIHV